MKGTVVVLLLYEGSGNDASRRIYYDPVNKSIRILNLVAQRRVLRSAPQFLTVTSSLIPSASFSSLQTLARYFNILVEGGVVISRKLVNISRIVVGGILSCDSQLFTVPEKRNRLFINLVHKVHCCINAI